MDKEVDDIVIYDVVENSVVNNGVISGQDESPTSNTVADADNNNSYNITNITSRYEIFESLESLHWQILRNEGYKRLFGYVVFLLLFIVVVMMQINVGAVSEISIALNAVLSTNLNTVATLDDLWNFLYQDSTGFGIMDSLFKEQLYNNQPLTPSQTGYFLDYNKLVGGVQISQSRMALPNNSCVSFLGPTIYNLYYPKCYSRNNVITEANLTFGTPETVLSPNEMHLTQSAWISDDSGNYVMFFSLSDGRSVALQKLAALKRALWLDSSTADVNCKFALYNGQIGPGMFSFVSISFKMSPGGSFMYNQMQINSFNMEPYRGVVDKIRMALEILFVTWIGMESCTFVVNVYMNIQQMGWSGVLQFPNIMNALTLVLFIVCVVIRVVILLIAVNNTIVVPTTKYEPIIERLSIIQARYISTVFATLAVAIVHLSSYIQFQARLDSLNQTFAFAFERLYHFSIPFFTVVCGFGAIGYTQFGTSAQAYSQFGISTMSCWRLAFGDFNSQTIFSLNPKMGPLFFVTTGVVLVLLLLNVLSGILVDAYRAVSVVDAPTVHQELSSWGKASLFRLGHRSAPTKRRVIDTLAQWKAQGHFVFEASNLIPTSSDPSFFDKLAESYNFILCTEANQKQLDTDSFENILNQLQVALQQNKHYRQALHL